jgi:hypothetical protein
MNKEKVTVQDCVEMQEMKNQSVVLNDGKIGTKVADVN